jgi:hypothetical protein
VDLVLGSLVYQLPGGVNLAYDLCLGCTIARWKGINEGIHFGGPIRALNLSLRFPIAKKRCLGPQNSPESLGSEKTAKHSKLPKNCFEIVGIGGWPQISTYIRNLFSKP